MSDPSDYVGDDRIVLAFEKRDEFIKLLKSFLAVDLLVQLSASEQAAEERTLLKLTNILDEYQEAAYLLDPYLEELIEPPIEALRAYAGHVSRTGAVGPTDRLELLSRLLYWYTKARGYKTIIRYFPHEATDFGLAFGLLTKTLETVAPWEVTYILLLWLSLICMLPFNLSLFDEKGKKPVVTILESKGLEQLSKAGKERDAAAVLLSKLYIRQDVEDRLETFFTWGMQTLQDPDRAYATLGFLQVVAELLKGGTHAALAHHLLDIGQLLDEIKQDTSLMRNTLIRKYCSKISCRLAVMQLPVRNAPKSVRTIRGDDNMLHNVDGIEETDDNIPETLDEHVEELATFLQEKDTIVRYSAAKGLARISERLPTEFASQVLDTILSLYSLHDEAVQAQEYTPDAEGTWHGATLACAEFARRGLVRGDHLSEVLKWASKALLFDIRKGAVSVGSNVRDAAAYVIWASARSQTTESMKPWALDLAQRLVAVSVFDREITIRRAASAAFQENVGRLNLFPHGIDVLRKTDFYAVSIRRHAFEIAAPEVAEHLEYRKSLLDHLETITLRHWDAQIRTLAATAYRRICDLDLLNLGPTLAVRQENMLTHPESTFVHGALLALANIGESLGCRTEPTLQAARLRIFQSISKVTLRKLQSFRGELLLGAVCDLVATSISQAALDLKSTGPPWRDILELGLRSRDELVQYSAAGAWSSISNITNCQVEVRRWVKDFATATPTIQQGIAKALGKLKYAAFPHKVQDAISCLSSAVRTRNPKYVTSIEVRRDCFVALNQIACQDGVIIGSDGNVALFQSLLLDFQQGLRDYTSDQRGDVGSWVRIESLKALGATISRVFESCTQLREPLQWISDDKLAELLGMMLKQSVERLDNVRDEVGTQLGLIMTAYMSKPVPSTIWKIEGATALQDLCDQKADRTWKERGWFFPKALQLLLLPTYRPFLLEGVAYSIGSKTETNLGPVGKALSDFAATLPVSESDGNTFSLCQLSRELLLQVRLDSSNNSYFVPYLQTFLVLLQADVLQSLDEAQEGRALLGEILDISVRNLARIKNVQRIVTSMKIVTSAAAIPSITRDTLVPLTLLLTHSVPRVREETAESLYVVAQTSELFGESEEKGEDLLLETSWLGGNDSEVRSAAEEVVHLIREGMAD
ncbi:ARM repeat-containing protein [Dacryopinax primogenitus]|uniref:ARM repeat-containing protein n=1 Tax=Dacryopinax primogenitus (strain DJM 731) TaxID=1858805 RepID=M5GAU2_DACPD|nr:ARM repeat-containing protein [Dacryopinax primogenitus]EJU03097.1 ARM repeat-containing protein [Dacryopinax primogenitus]